MVTCAERVSETVFFKHKYLTNSTVTCADRVVQAARELYDALSKKIQGMEKATYHGRPERTKQNVSQNSRED